MPKSRLKKNMKNHEHPMKNRYEKHWTIQTIFIKKSVHKYVNSLFLSNGKPISEKRHFEKVFFPSKIRSKITLETSMFEPSKNHQKMMPKWSQNPSKIDENPSKNRCQKKDGPKSRNIEAWSAQGSKNPLRLSCEPRGSGPVGPHNPTKRAQIEQMIPHANGPLARRICNPG